MGERRRHRLERIQGGAVLYRGEDRGFLGVRAKRGRAARAATELGLISSPDRTRRVVGDDGWGPPVGETERGEGGLGCWAGRGKKNLGPDKEERREAGLGRWWKKKREEKVGPGRKGRERGKMFSFFFQKNSTHSTLNLNTRIQIQTEQ